MSNECNFGLAGHLALVLSFLLSAPVGWAQTPEIDPVLLEEGAEIPDPLATEGGDEPSPAVGAGERAPVPAVAPDPYELRLAALEATFDAGVDAWRLGDYATAENHWMAVLDELTSMPIEVDGHETVVDRHALLHDLGNAAFRLERPLEAVGWYMAALRHAPRDVETHENLALARREAGLESEPNPDFVRSLTDALGLFTPAESRWLALIGLLPLLVCLLGEAARGGRLWRGLLVLSILIGVAATAPLVRHGLRGGERPVLIVDEQRVEYRAEPLEERPSIGAVEPGAVVQALDALPDWIRIETVEGDRGWVSRGAVFELVR